MKWISVKTRLPREGQFVAVLEWDEGLAWDSHAFEWRDFKVSDGWTHWAPLTLPTLPRRKK